MAFFLSVIVACSVDLFKKKNKSMLQATLFLSVVDLLL